MRLGKYLALFLVALAKVNDKNGTPWPNTTMFIEMQASETLQSLNNTVGMNAGASTRAVIGGLARVNITKDVRPDAITVIFMSLSVPVHKHSNISFPLVADGKVDVTLASPVNAHFSIHGPPSLDFEPALLKQLNEVNVDSAVNANLFIDFKVRVKCIDDSSAVIPVMDNVIAGVRIELDMDLSSLETDSLSDVQSSSTSSHIKRSFALLTLGCLMLSLTLLRVRGYLYERSIQGELVACIRLQKVMNLLPYLAACVLSIFVYLTHRMTRCGSSDFVCHAYILGAAVAPSSAILFIHYVAGKLGYRSKERKSGSHRVVKPGNRAPSLGASFHGEHKDVDVSIEDKL